MPKFEIYVVLFLLSVSTVFAQENGNSNEEKCPACLSFLDEMQESYTDDNIVIKAEIIRFLCRGMGSFFKIALCQLQLAPFMGNVFGSINEIFASPNITCVQQGACSSDILPDDIMFDSSMLDSFNTSCLNCTQEVENNKKNLKKYPAKTILEICRVNPSNNGMCEANCAAMKDVLDEKMLKKGSPEMLCEIMGYCASNELYNV